MSTTPKARAADFTELLVGLPPDLQLICRMLRRIILELHPDAVQLIWPTQGIASFGFGPKKLSQHHVYIAPQNHHVNLGLYHGVDVEDPADLMEGTGKRMRHVKLREASEAELPALRDLIAAAIHERTHG